MPRLTLDAIDRRILEELQANGRLSNVALAERVGLSPSPCLRRVKILERSGVISGYRAILDRRGAGLTLTVFVGLKVGRHHAEEYQAFKDAISNVPEIIACHLVSGDTDFLLEVVVTDVDGYDRFLLGTLLKLPGVTDIRSSIAIRALKPTGTLPVSHLPSG